MAPRLGVLLFGNDSRGLVPGNGNRTSAGYRWPCTQRKGPVIGGNKESAPFSVMVTGPPSFTGLRPTLLQCLFGHSGGHKAAAITSLSAGEGRAAFSDFHR